MVDHLIETAFPVEAFDQGIDHFWGRRMALAGCPTSWAHVRKALGPLKVDDPGGL